MAHHHRHLELHRAHAGPLQERAADPAEEPGVQTLYSVVYVTAKPTFTGSIAGFVTLGTPVRTPAIHSSSATPSPSHKSDDNDSETSSTRPAFLKGTPLAHSPSSHSDSDVQSTSTSLSLSSDASSGIFPSSVTKSALPTHIVAAASSSSLALSSFASFADSAPTSTTTPTSEQSTKQSSGLSGGASAGIAVVVILAVAALVFFIWFMRRRSKAHMKGQEQLDDEKTASHQAQASLASHVSVRRTKTEAPRLSLRPVTQMFPDEKHAPMPQDDNTHLQAHAPANLAPMARAKTPEMFTAPQSTRGSWEKTEQADPFGDHAEATKEAAGIVTDNHPLMAPVSPPPVSPSLASVTAPAPLVVKQDRPINAEGEPRDNNLGRSSPAPSFSSTAPSMGPGGPGPNNVHRVQLDFKPSMQDELELRAGQVVRMLHEYDDGWALCIRLDRSQQGVVPRSCISKLPLKPRPGPPPQAMRGPPPPGMRGPPRGPPHGRPSNRPHGPPRAMSPTGSVVSTASSGVYFDSRQRQMPPAGNRMRSQSNAPAPYASQPRPMSPGPFGSGSYRSGPSDPPAGRARSSSTSMASRRTTPPNMAPYSPQSTSPTQQSMPSRKPVPGQAL